MASSAITGGNTVVDQTGPHARGPVPLRKYPEIVFTEGEFDTTANGTESTYWAGPSTVFQGGYSLKTSHHSTDDGGRFGWNAFDGNEETFWKNVEDYESSTGNYDYGNTGVQSRLTDTSSTNHDGDHVIMGSPNKLKIAKVVVTCKAAIRRVVNYSVLGSNLTGTTGWTLLNSGTFNAQDVNTATITSPTSYFKYHAFVVRSVTPGADGQRFQINSIDFYGYEEDPPAGDTSVDTIITSQFNLPDTTGVKLYIDGDKGSTPTDYSGEGHTLTDNSESFSGNAWSFSSLATSNVTMSTGIWRWRGRTHTPCPCGSTRRTSPRMPHCSTLGPPRVRVTPRPPSHSQSPDTWDGSMVVTISSFPRTRGTISCTPRRGVVVYARATSTVESWGTPKCKTRSGSTRRLR
jgi:hypothetical protein